MPETTEMIFTNKIPGKGIYVDISDIGNFNSVKEAAILANEVLENDAFYARIASHPFFDFSDASPATIARLMRETSITMAFDLYYAKSHVRNIDGYDDQENPFVIHMNVWKIDRSPESMCNTIIHACVHALNACHAQYYFGHGDNSLTGKENTAPYWIGALAQQIVSHEDTIIIPFEHDPFESHLKNIEKQFAHTQFLMA